MLHAHRAVRTAELATGLAAALASTPPDAFQPEVVAVPSKGVERWLAQRLSHTLGSDRGDGVCANVTFPTPSRLLADAFTAGSGVDPDDDPWGTGRTTWTLLGVIDDCLGEPWCAALTTHLQGSTEHAPGRRLTTAQRLARLFATYAASRPQMLRGWLAGDDTDGTGQPLPDDLRWQAEIWRRLRTTIGVESLAERLPAACRSLTDDPAIVDLPDRVSIFGPTRLTTAELDVLGALADHRDVHLWLPHPSPALWQKLQDHEPTGSRRRDDATGARTNQALLASLGRDVRELQLRLRAQAPGHTDEHIDSAEGLPDTLLGRLQRAIRDDADPAAAANPIDETDRSLQVHACHGPARQVEVLREVLVGLLEDDDTLEPRDVLVMCPDIEDYAPLISATFGLADTSTATGDETAHAHPGHRLRVRLADRSLRQTNPMLGLLASLLDLAAGRVTATQVLDLAALPPVRRRFHLSDDELETLQVWVPTSGVRWGLDGPHRAPYGLDGIGQNTWRAGLDRILLGAAMADDDLQWVGTALPLDDVDSNDVDLAGRLAELVDRLRHTLDRLAGSHPLDHWLDTLADALDLLGEVSETDAWQAGQARRELADVRADATGHAAGTELTLGDVHVLLADRLAGRPTRANFRTGNLTMCSMVPMRSVPHRVICLLGLDDGAFPRGSGVDGDDVLARDPCLGERDPRSEDRQLLLDAILAAQEHLVVLYTGADPRTNTTQPPAVPVGELLDAVDAIATHDGTPARERVVTRHPLQPFDQRNFTPGALGVAGPFSFDRIALRGALAALDPRVDRGRFLAARLDPPATGGDIELDDLVRFFEHPAKALLRQRLGVAVLSDEETIHDEMAVELAALDRYAVGERVLQSCLAGADFRRACSAEWRRGLLPPAQLGRRAADELEPLVDAMVALCAPFLTAAAAVVDVSAALGDTRIVGTVPGVRDLTVLRATFATLAPKHRLRAWIQLLVLTAARPDEEWRAVTIGRDRQRVRGCAIGPVDATQARRWLGELVGLYRDGLCLPLPLAPKTSSEYAKRRRGGDDVAAALLDAGKQWADRDHPERDDAFELVWGVGAPVEVLCEEPAASSDGEPTRFGEVALRVWEPLLDAETPVR